MSEPQPVCLYEKREPHIAIIRLNRPEKKNSISRDLYWALDECWQKAKADDDVWSIILTGTADSFCAGGDLMIVPASGLRVQVTAVLLVFKTVAVNGCVSPARQRGRGRSDPHRHVG